MDVTQRVQWKSKITQCCQTRQNKFFQDYWRACFEINFSDRQEGLTVSSIICDR